MTNITTENIRQVLNASDNIYDIFLESYIMLRNDQIEVSRAGRDRKNLGTIFELSYIFSELDCFRSKNSDTNFSADDKEILEQTLTKCNNDVNLKLFLLELLKKIDMPYCDPYAVSIKYSLGPEDTTSIYTFTPNGDSATTVKPLNTDKTTAKGEVHFRHNAILTLLNENPHMKH